MVEDLVPNLRAALGEVLPGSWRDAAPWGYPAQCELALITGVFASQVPAASVAEIADTVMRRSPGKLLDDLTGLVDADTAGIQHLIGERWGDTTVLGVPRRRAEVIHEAARLLVGTGIRHAKELQEAVREREASVANLLLAVRGLGPGTWESIAFMVHAPLRPGADVVAYVRSLLGPDGDALETDEVRAMIVLTARRFAVEERVLAFALRQLVDSRAQRADQLAAQGS
ncbi:hypothetical protein [Demequina lignilytica]|uniref:Uncharacterized protein n=1 Tax=Demequina lignilytica TaxID=3051663 RepID=A0AAW7M5H1_9MICO|nr:MULTISPECIES: hypothetical protein [unclassified Demequina]MDN4477028.1 hypothetical protein [Demequina sp. SYSU T00039-1]MDN4483876.1 hypothetical protein [Demequina sp. SYSU T0a273]MDN4487201.1 hypothetical protein [Demequina sp. SYSU T00039]